MGSEVYSAAARRRRRCTLRPGVGDGRAALRVASAAACAAAALTLLACGRSDQAPADAALPEAQVRTALEAAERYLNSGDPQSARTIAAGVVARGDRADALDILARCEILRAEDAASEEEAAAALLAAADAYARASGAAPADAALAARAAIAADQAGQSERCVPLYRTALEADPGSVQLRVFLGFALVRGGDLEGARAVLEQAATLAPDSPWPLAALSARAIRGGDAAGALELARRARALGPDDPSVRVCEAQAMRAGGNAAGALSLMLALEQARRLSPECVSEIAACHRALGHPQDAARAWEELAQSAAGTRRAALEAALCWDEAGDAEQARSWRDAAARLPRRPRPSRPQ